MDTTYTKARFWKCALQVNPAGYIQFRGTDHGLSEEEYNQKLLQKAKENDIKVIGLADHGNVDAVDAIRELFADSGILVFPGFEIASTEKVHFVCLFPEDTTRSQLDRYIGALGLTDPKDGVRPSNLGGNDLLAKVEDLGGFAYAAHCTEENGILFRKLNHVWKNPLLRAAQIPGTLDDLKNDEGNSYRLILQNKDPNYEREHPLAILNACDVAIPDDLDKPNASCLIKMTRPGFDAFKLAFQDPESRVRLLTDQPPQWFSRIEQLRITGGYLDGVEIDFSDHLNTVIGGRGTGKSTLIECIRYAFGTPPIGKNAQRQHQEIIKENLGKEGGRIEILIRSSAMNGRRFTVARRYGENPVVTDSENTPSTFTPIDLLPRVEIYGQNEIYEIAFDPALQIRLLERFLADDAATAEQRIDELLKKLRENREKLVRAQTGVADIEQELSRLKRLEERVQQFKELGLEDKLGIIPHLETERNLLKRATTEEIPNLKDAFQSIRDNLPDTAFLSDAALKELPHVDLLKKLRSILQKLRSDVEGLLKSMEDRHGEAEKAAGETAAAIEEAIRSEEAKLEEVFKGLPATEGKTGREIGTEYQKLLRDIAELRPKKATYKTRKQLLDELEKERRGLLNELSKARAERSARFARELKALNRKLDGKLRLTAEAGGDREAVIRFLLDSRLEGVGEKRLAWIRDAEDFSPVKLAETIRSGVDALAGTDWAVTPAVAEALCRLPRSRLWEMEELNIEDRIHIELNVSHAEHEEFKPIEKLSTGQQCTAILHLLLLRNVDPLIMDQPEDNLDNAFIAERIVTELRDAKISRQFLFATHNANIPVFGDAEWIGVFSAESGRGLLPPESQGAIDVPLIRNEAARILEGGRKAFEQRKEKYGF